MIQILNLKFQEIEQRLKEINIKEASSKKTNLPDEIIQNIKILLSNASLHNLLSDIAKPEYYESLSYELLCDLFDIISILYDNLNTIKTSIDIDIFFREGYNLDIDKLKEIYKSKKLHKQLPDLDFKRLQELYRKPPEKIHTYHNQEEYIIIDPFIYRKYLIGIIQMVFNHMDLLICSVGPEGSGKSTKISQDMLLMHWTLSELKIISYKFDINELWFNTLSKFRDAEDKYFSEPFRIIGLDEGNELNRQDWKDEEVKTFFQRLRRERHNRRIKFICLPVLGEMITNIILSRMNFISDMVNKNQLKTGTLYKGEFNFYIIPRGDTIYSPFHKKELTRADIKNKLYTNLKDKEYLKGMPKDIIIKKCKCNGVWGFKEEDYIKELKESNKTYTVGKGITFGYTELFNFYKSHVTLKKLHIKKDDPRYASLAKMISKINNLFYENPDLLLKYEAIYNKKVEDKLNSQ